MTFKVGDLAKLKSGGPTMTVSGVDNFGIRTIIRCTWFADSKKEQGEFPLEALASPPPIVMKKVNVTRDDPELQK